MKIHDIKGKHVKTVPVRYEACENIFSHFTDFDHKRLTTDERFNIEMALFKQSLDLHTRRELVGKKVVKARMVHLRNKESYYTILFGKKEEFNLTYSFKFPETSPFKSFQRSYIILIYVGYPFLEPLASSHF